MSRRTPKTKFRCGDQVLIIGPTVPGINSGTAYTLPPGTVGTVDDMWEAFGEYVVVVDGYSAPWVFPESSLATEPTTTSADHRSENGSAS